MEGSAGYLAAALEDESLWVRVGAGLVTPALCPASAPKLLLPRLRTLERANENLLETAIERAALITSVERSGVDSGPQLANLLGDSAAELEAAIGVPHVTAEAREQAHERWGEHLDAKVDAKVLPLEAARLLLPVRVVRLAGMRHRAAVASGVQATEAPWPSPASRVLWEMRHWTAAFHVGEDRDQVIKSSSLARAASRLEAGDLSGASGARDELIRIVLSEPNGMVRAVARKTLASTGPAGSLPLLAALHGDPPYLLTTAEASRIGASQGTGRRELEDRRRLAAHLAAEALAEFTDPASALAVASLAIGSNGGAAARAEHVLAHMSTDCALPALFWCLVNRTGAEERDRAQALLSRIVAKDPAYELDFYRIGPSRFGEHLDWVPALAERAMRLGRWQGGPGDEPTLGWARDQDVSLGLLGSAIRAIPEVYGHPLVLDQDATDRGRFASFARSVGAILHRRSAAHAPAKERRTPRLRFPERCLLGALATLSVQLDLAGASQESAGSFDVPFAAGADEVKLLVLVRAPGFAIEPDFAVLVVPRAAPSATATFMLRARELGPQVVEVTFLLNAERIGHYCLTSRVGQTTGAASSDADTRVLQALTAADLVQREETRAAILVDAQPDGRLAYRILDPAIDPMTPRAAGVSPVAVTAQLAKEWVEQQGAIIREQLGEDYSEADLKGVLATVAAVGQSLFKQIVPAELAEAVRGWPADAVIAVESDVSWIPWEMLTESTAAELWGERFQIIRMPVIPRGRKVPVPLLSLDEPGSRGARALAKVSAIVGDEIADRDEDPVSVNRELFDGLLPIVTDLIEVTWDQLLSGVDNADVVHFTCHVRRKPVLNLSYGPTAGRKLYVAQVEALGFRPGAVVFANGCSSAKPELMLAEFENFGFEFYAHGARPYIGTLGPVPVRAARAFARLFYKWFILRGLPAGQALRQARREAAQEMRTPVWLFYCVYGPASALRTYDGRSVS